MERADVFVLRGDAALRKAKEGHCASLSLLHEGRARRSLHGVLSAHGRERADRPKLHGLLSAPQGGEAEYPIGTSSSKPTTSTFLRTRRRHCWRMARKQRG